MPSPANVHIKKFEAHRDDEGRRRKYALVYSAERRPMNALGGMEFDAQAAFIGGGSSWSESEHQANDQFGELKHEEGADLTLMFIPRKDEERAIRSIKEAMDAWSKGKSNQSWNPDESWLRPFDMGFVAMGLNFTPDGMFVAFLDAIDHGQLRVASAAAGNGDRFLETGGVAIESVHWADEELALGSSAVYWQGSYNAKGGDLWGCALYEDVMSRGGASLPSDDPSVRFIEFLRAQMEAKALRDIVNATARQDGQGGVAARGPAVNEKASTARPSKRI